MNRRYQLYLDGKLSAELKGEGLDAAEQHNRDFILLMRAAAIKISNERGCVSSDDLRVVASQLDREPSHPNIWGAIFRGPKWTVIGRRKSAVPENHHREIKIWRYEP